MSYLVALVFDDPYKAEEARAAVNRMVGEGLLEVSETAVVIKPAEGKTRVMQDVNVVASTRKIGHMAGIAAAAVTGTLPFIFLGTLSGQLVGMLKDHGITNRFLREVQKELQPGTSALIGVGRSDAERRQRAFERLRPFNPKILQADLPPEVEEELQRVLNQPPDG
jgi:uncharacterized membrane protein